MGKFRFFLAVLLIFLGVMSIGYYFGMVAIGGVIAFSEFWILLGIALFILAFIQLFHNKIKFKLPKKVKIILISTFSIGLAFFIFVEGILLYYGNKKEIVKPDYIMVLGAGLK